ncbi:MAG: histidinol-phosphate transaminase [Gammaproteobacteria bacterium]|nr:histidinol-phosphate transaminase [Gammaproteobacteria bacterium]
MSKFWSKIVNELEPYVPGEQPQDQQYIKLNTNESPYPPSPAVARALADFNCDDLRRYPDPESRRLVEALAEYHGLTPPQVFVGNGSDEVLAHAFQALLQKPAPVLFPDISYSFYPVYCALYRIEYQTVALDEAFRINLDDYPSDNGGIILANPNAPTGIALDLEKIEEMLNRSRESVVIIDEAYVDFGAESAIRLIAEYDNLLVVQTFSKSRSFAGLRLGAAFGDAALIEALQRIKNSFNSYPIDSPANVCAIASLADEAYFQQCRERIIASRERLNAALAALGFEVFPSSSNFVFVRHAEMAAETLYQELKATGILVRYFNKARIDNCLRITIGNDSECDALLAAMQKILGQVIAL